MQVRILSLIVWPMLGMLCQSVMAQAPIRQEDHFYRRKVVNRIDLQEKINLPLIQQESPIYGNTGDPTKQGMVAAMLKGLEDGRYVAYHPDDPNRVMTYDEVLARIQELEFTGAEDIEDWEGGLEESTGSEFVSEWTGEFDGEEEWVSEAPEEEIDNAIDYAAFESVIQFVEDRVFDKNRGEMVYHYDYFQIIWSDPGETLPEKVLCVFRYADVEETLDEVVWINRHNDAERRSVKEIFDLRLFNSYIINVSGDGVQTLAEAEFRRQQLVDYEHHLWHY